MAKQKEKYNMNLKLLKEYDVDCLMTSALEGGSNYWYLIKDEAVFAVKYATQEMTGEPFVDRLLTAISRGVSVEIHDAENEDEVLGTLTNESWAKGEAFLMMEQYESHLTDILDENDDASTGDVFFQLCLMGEIVYG